MRYIKFRIPTLLGLFLLLFHSFDASAQTMTSPNGKIDVMYNGSTFSVSYNTGRSKVPVTVINHYGTISSEDSSTVVSAQMTGNVKAIHEEYRMIEGKKSLCRNDAFEYTWRLQKSNGLSERLVFRLYKNGVAFRYEDSFDKPTLITGERTSFVIPDCENRWIQKYQESYEDFYPMTNCGDDTNYGSAYQQTTQDHHFSFPALFEKHKGQDTIWSLVTEGNLERFHPSTSMKADWHPNELYTSYNLVLGNNKQSFEGDWHSPWRLIIMGSLDDIVQSTLVTDVSEPCKLKDTSWIKPGVVSWVYWAYNHGSKDYQIVRKYIDMAVRLKLPYVLIDAEWDVMGNGGKLEDAIKYANDRGIKVLMWYNSSTAWCGQGAPGPLFRLNKREDRIKEFKKLVKLGVAGIKVDFFEGDTQACNEYCIDLISDAAKYHLLINFHGTTIPRGWQRTYPNLVSTEAVYGAEWYNNKPQLTNKAAWHNSVLPFTRNVVGPMDYTPCAFSDSQHPHITTNAHELALTVLFESSLQHLADKPESYFAQPGSVQEFFGSLPTTWDETRLVGGYPGDYVVMARRKGDVWYVAGINGTNSEKTVSIDLSFISEAPVHYTLFADGNVKNEKNDHTWKIDSSILALPKTMTMKAKGGFVIRVK